ncbi:Magnesium transporting ATPase P-type 1, partial [Salmonella enterica subsp. enterica serovar Johannesburg str. S5-703]
MLIGQGFAAPEEFSAPDFGAEGLPMLKTITRQLFARLNRHLPYRLVHRDPLPGAQTAVNATIPPSLSERCLKVAAMEQETLWRVFDTHPEGLNAAEVTRVKSMAKTA